MLMEKYLTIGIDPSGIGVTGIYIKTFNYQWPKRWYENIEASIPVEAAIKIIEYINKIKKTLPEEIFIKEVIVEVPHKGIEKWKEVKATRELVGILKYVYKNKFKGHQPNHKDKKLKELIKNSKKYLSDHQLDAEVIMHAHFREKVFGWCCENYLGREIPHEKKDK